MKINESVTDTIIVYMILKKLSKPFEEWDAYKLGIIDVDGNRIKKPQTLQDHESWSLLDRMVCKIKRIMQKFVGKSRIAAMLTAAYMLKENFVFVSNHHPEIFLKEESSMSGWTHEQNQRFNEIVRSLPMPVPRIYSIADDATKFEIDLYKYHKLVETVLSVRDEKEIEKILDRSHGKIVE